MKEQLIESITAAIIEAINNGSVLVESTENGGIRVIRIEEKPKPRKSGIYFCEDNANVYVIFGGGIHVAVGECKSENGYAIGLQELNEIKECGAEHNEEWLKEKPTVNLIIKNKNTINILRDALNIIDKKLSNKTEKKEEDLPIDTPCMVGNGSKKLWSLRYYAYDGKVFMNGLKSKDKGNLMKYDYTIPFDKFNPNDIEESLKYNIVKK